ncbi:HNH endonuclease signature motif containing protein [Myceligenerans salitolerans]|nr:HNH endonuclease signature motif containing protein [Myceligenerans salitolerans]
MDGQTLHDGGRARLDVVLPETSWADPGMLDAEQPHDGAPGDASVDTLVAQTRASEPGPWLANLLHLAVVAAAGSGGGEGTTGAPATGVLGRLDAVELAEVVAAAQRLAGWAHAVQARAAGALVEAQGGILGVDQAATVVKDRLGVTAREGSVIVNRADRCARFPDVLTALEAGRIDARKADALLGAGAELTDAERAAAIDVLLPEAPTRTWKWLSEQLNALAARLHGSSDELAHAADQRNVWLETAGPGMALLTALLPAKDGARLFNAVQAGAQALMNLPGQTRRRGQARADALTSLVTGRMVPHPLDEAPDTGDSAPSATTAPAPIPTAPPGALVPPVRDTDLVPVPDEDDGVLSTAPASGVVVRGVEVPATVNVTVPASVLADPSDDTPGILDLLGPIPAALARDIAAEGVWHRLVTDPVTGILTDYSTGSYQPPPRLRRAVEARDRVCAHAGCDRPAAGCDLDHIERYDHDRPYRPGEPGQTSATNLHALCRKHHNLKTHAGWQVRRDPTTGTETWTSPHGHTQVYQADPIDPGARYGTTAHLTAGTARGADAAPATADPPNGLTLARPRPAPRPTPVETPPPSPPGEDAPPPF